MRSLNTEQRTIKSVSAEAPFALFLLCLLFHGFPLLSRPSSSPLLQGAALLSISVLRPGEGS